ncbi:MAG: hypothetical protein KJ063_24885 [Anaerolineae bacterium]|nr:hypothetical protein [Anaerolineae bacterium]
MKKRIFTGDVRVEIQGPRVLRLLHQSPSYAEYEVIGFEDRIFLRDFRLTTLAALDEGFEKEDFSQFPYQFSRDAHIAIYSTESPEGLWIELRDSNKSIEPYKLLIAIGLEDGIPIYHYRVGRISQMDEHRYALVGLVDMEDDVIYSPGSPLVLCAS